MSDIDDLASTFSKVRLLDFDNDYAVTKSVTVYCQNLWAYLLNVVYYLGKMSLKCSATMLPLPGVSLKGSQFCKFSLNIGRLSYLLQFEIQNT